MDKKIKTLTTSLNGYFEQGKNLYCYDLTSEDDNRELVVEFKNEYDDYYTATLTTRFGDPEVIKNVGKFTLDNIKELAEYMINNGLEVQDTF